MSKPPSKWTPEEVRQRVLKLGPWFHNMDLMGVQTAPGHFLGDYPAVKWRSFCSSIPEDLSGKTVLDIGCNAGFYSIEMKRRGARKVTAIDSDGDYLAQAAFAAEVSGADIDFRLLSVYDVAKLKETFDIVLFMGLIYHLRYPLLALDLVHKHVAADVLIFQSMLRGSPQVDRVEKDYPFNERDVFLSPGFPKMYFIEGSYCNDPTNWWLPNAACAEAMLRSAGFRIVARPEPEVYICRSVPGKAVGP